MAGTAAATPLTGKAHDSAHASAVPAGQAVSKAEIVKAARAAAVTHSSATGVGKTETLTVKDTLIDPEGKLHVRFSRVYRGVPVVGGDLVVHLDAKKNYLGATRAIRHQISLPSVTPKLTAPQAAAKAAASADGKAAKTELVVDATNGTSVLAYRVTVTDSKKAAETGGTHSVVVDAGSGKVLSSTPLAEPFISPQLKAKLRSTGQQAAPKPAGKSTPPATTGKAKGAFPAQANGTGASIFVGNVPLTTTQTAQNSFTLKDPSRGGGETRDAGGKELERFTDGKAFTDSDNRWGNGTNSDPSTAAVDAQYGITSTFDYYKSTFGRNGIKDDGAGPNALVHFGDKVGNAFWSPDCSCMLYGDGDGETFKQPLVALDVTGHELSHGVIEATANFQPTRVDERQNQFGEAGSLNESFADIFGTAVEFKTNNPANPPNYLMGEKLGLEQKFLRRMDRPSEDKLEGTVDYWDSGSYDREVHAGSGVSSHAFYLLAEGSGKKTIGGVEYDSPTYDGSTVSGIGRDKAEQIFYRALTRYMVSTTDFHEARKATLDAAADIYGKDSAEYKTVDKAWAAVNVTEANTPKEGPAAKH
ncbi:M4 family metallopeptidase [Streptomyces sp. UNOC14_S4]|uniref:M4 family metallopeptidase n=1 Tax=Streptomyces sp. UNOC14_S4 TaxID=2872340 RepID=UPI001E65BFFC|nr:M4 family metallopeptidase [Streptomyces sp. UNOC14_S4]MCC3768758.1 M4 family metallopeptidase [Streptomyces sp. UNOC14_S4]